MQSILFCIRPTALNRTMHTWMIRTKNIVRVKDGSICILWGSGQAFGSYLLGFHVKPPSITSSVYITKHLYCNMLHTHCDSLRELCYTFNAICLYILRCGIALQSPSAQVPWRCRWASPSFAFPRASAHRTWQTPPSPLQLRSPQSRQWHIASEGCGPPCTRVPHSARWVPASCRTDF